MSPGDRMTIRGILEAVALISCLTISGFATEAPRVYVHHCVSCHGSDGSGRKTPALGQVPDLRSKRIASLTDEQLYNTIAYGNGHQAYAHSFQRLGLADSELRQTVRYIRDMQAHRKSQTD